MLLQGNPPLLNTGGDTLQTYIEDTHSTTLACTALLATPSATQVYQIRKIGKTVILKLNTTSLAANGAGVAAVMTFTTPLPAAYRPSSDFASLLSCENNAAAVTGSIHIVATTGAVTISATSLAATGVFSIAGGNNGFLGSTLVFTSST